MIRVLMRTEGHSGQKVLMAHQRLVECSGLSIIQEMLRTCPLSEASE